MDIYRFINSRDVAKHLKKTGYQFSSLEMAWIIWHSAGATVKEKHEAWNELIETTEDCEIPDRMNCAYYESLHKFLSDYMEMEDRVIEHFKRDDGIFSFSFYDSNTTCYHDEFKRFNDFETCVKEAWEKDGVIVTDVSDWEEYLWTAPYRTITKRYPTKEDGVFNGVNATIDKEGNFLDIEYSLAVDDIDEDLSIAFEGMWFSIPVPFEKGDIVVDSTMAYSKGYCKGPFVLEGTVYGDNIIPLIVDDGDTTDMCAWGYFAHEDGDVYNENMSNYFDLEYYKGPLVDEYRTLKCISAYLKHKINLDEALRYYHAILLDLEKNKYEESLQYVDKYKEIGGVKVNEKELYIYLDDEREAPDGYLRTRSVNETIKVIEDAEKNNKEIMLLDLDHDLGDYAKDGGDAIKLLDWLVERNTLYPIKIHTMNCVGRENMERMIERYWY